MMRLARSFVALLLILLAACAGDMRRQQLETQLSTLPPDQALELLAQQSAQYPDDLQVRSEYLQIRRRVMEDYLTRATTAYYANDLAQARMWVQRAQQAAPGDDNPVRMLEWIDTQGPIDSAVQYAESIRAERPDEALAVANDVLRRQPGNLRAARLRDDLLTPRGRELTPTLTRDLSQPITVQFRDQPLISIFELVSNITGLNFTFDHDVAATAPTTIFATNTPVKQVMAMVLQANQLASKVVNGTSLLIYPPTLSALVDGVPDKTSPTHSRLYFLRRIPRDPMCDCPSKADAQTWGKRSYASPPDSPGEGTDVYDVYSLSEEQGINGIPYRKW